MAMKFFDDGRVRPYPGNTIICNVIPDSPIHRCMVRLQQELTVLPYADAFAFLPPNSFHMTLFRGVNDQLRVLGEWPRNLAMETPLEEVTREFCARLKTVTLPGGFRMRANSLTNTGTGEIQLFIEGADETERENLKTARRLLSKTLRHERSGDDDDHFHISFAYRIKSISEEETERLGESCRRLFNEIVAPVGCFEVGPPTFCRFPDMLSFIPLLDLSIPHDTRDGCCD